MRGNPCLFHVAEQPPRQPPGAAAITQCITWPTGPGRAQVRCWSPSGQEIQLCGHGLLCSSYHWNDGTTTDMVLNMGNVEVLADYRDGLHWIGFPTLGCRPTRIPGWADNLLGSQPTRAAAAGPGDGYLVLDMSEDCDIAALPAPGAVLVDLSARSLIVTRRVNTASALCGETIQYRYFAPQYGVPEDMATGSAMRVLAAYWQQRGAGNELRALQRSADGGWLLSRIDGDRTWIGGCVQDDTREVA